MISGFYLSGIFNGEKKQTGNKWRVDDKRQDDERAACYHMECSCNGDDSVECTMQPVTGCMKCDENVSLAFSNVAIQIK